MQQQIILGSIICFATFLLIILIIGWDVVEITNWGLKCNSISKQCDKQIYAPGRYLVGPFNSFFNFPGSRQAIEFSDDKRAQSQPLKTRTAEGLTLSLHVSFQYQLIKNEIALLYAMAGLNYEATFIRMARDTILQAAGRFEAPKYWTNRRNITEVMQKQLEEELKKAHANCVSLQILDIDLPDQYEDSIVQTQIEVQKKTMKQFEQKAQMILNDILVMRAQNDQEIFVIHAQAQADAFSITQAAQAKANKLLLEAESKGYEMIQKNLELSQEEFNQYLYWISILKQKKAKLVFNPNTVLTFNMNRN
ncbi:unnamed protein product [Paramecium primaurelia]|uniref:Band 7 domain-containing protein n=1 Tax=Paramecium primaurelia TaxID=5886 RepID=A0A8S1PT83_PARPR|nr:unnamed protein product [Paramecium primaurelia]